MNTGTMCGKAMATRGQFIVMLAALVLAACGSESPPAATSGVPVTVVTLQAQPVTLTREFPGRVAASLVAEVRPQVSGIVEARLFDEGSLVEAGQVLYRLDDETYRADVNSAKAALERAQATQRAAALTAARSAELAKINAISVQDNENAAAALRQAQADVSAATAVLDRARVLLGYATITSPIAGRIGKSSVTQGALVTANQAAPLAIVQQFDPVNVDVSPSNAEFMQLRRTVASGALTSTTDLPVTILLEDGSTYERSGTLSFADLSVDPTTGSFTLRVTVPNPDDFLLPGTYVRAVLGAGHRENALLVPQRAVSRDPRGNTSVLVVGHDNIVEQRPVVVSRSIGDRWLVEDGLSSGEQVIVEGLQKVRPGSAVLPSEAPASSPDSAAPLPDSAAPLPDSAAPLPDSAMRGG